MIRFDYMCRVRYKDIDQMGIVYYSRYFEFYESARTDMMRALGMTYSHLEAQGVLMPVVKTESEYLNGAVFDEELRIITEIREIHRNRMEIFYTVISNGDNRKLNIGKTTHAFVSANGKAMRIPGELHDLLLEKWGSVL